MLTRRRFLLLSATASIIPAIPPGVAQTAQPNRVQAWNDLVKKLDLHYRQLELVRDALTAAADKGPTVISVELIGSVRRTDVAFKGVEKAWKTFKNTVLA